MFCYLSVRTTQNLPQIPLCSSLCIAQCHFSHSSQPMGSLVIGTKAVYAHPDVSAAMAMWSSRSSTRTQADFSALQSSGADSVHICPCALSAAELRVGTPFHTAVTNCRAATPFVTVENTEPVPSLPRKMCWSRQMSHLSARLGFFCCCWVFFFPF